MTTPVSPASWLKSNAPALSNEEHNRLVKAYAAKNNPTNDQAYYAFVHRVCKEYKAFIVGKSRLFDTLHNSKRDTLIASAISQVFCQILPTNKPHAGDIAAAKDSVIDILESVFRMPNAGSSFGSPAWIQAQCSKPREIPFNYAAKWPKLMKRVVKHLMKHGGDHGFPLLQVGEEVPHEGSYKAHDHPSRAKGSKKTHKLLTFLNVSSVNKAVADLKDLGLYPVRCKYMPDGSDWNNFAQVLYSFWILYCYYEGITRTQELARQVLVYLFYAHLPGPAARPVALPKSGRSSG